MTYAHLILSKQTPSAGQTVPGQFLDQTLTFAQIVFFEDTQPIFERHTLFTRQLISIVNNNKKCIGFKVFKKHFVSVLGVLSMPEN